jgi:hypothetical protein
MRVSPADNLRFLRAARVGEESMVSIKQMQVSWSTPIYSKTMIFPPIKPKSSISKDREETAKEIYSMICAKK